MTIIESPIEWDELWMKVAQVIAKKSKDPSTQVGCVIVRPDNTICSTGYNGFPRLIKDEKALYDNREEKYARVIHGEMNALLFAKEEVKGYSIYQVPGMSCCRCAVCLIQAGIKKVVYSTYTHSPAMNTKLAEELFREAGVELVKYELR